MRAKRRKIHALRVPPPPQKKKNPPTPYSKALSENVGLIFFFRSNSEFKPEEGIEGRIEEYPEDITVLSVPFSQGNATILVNKVVNDIRCAILY